MPAGAAGRRSKFAHAASGRQAIRPIARGVEWPAVSLPDLTPPLVSP